MICSLPQLETFRDALVSAFHTPDEFNEYAVATGHVSSVEVDIGAGALKHVAYKFLLIAQANGGLDELLETAMARRPRNEKLLAFAKAVGATRVVATADLLDTRSFDLRPLEAIWRAELSSPERRLVVFALCGADQNVLGHVVARLRVHVGQPSSTSGLRFALDAKLSSIESTVDLVARFKSRLANHGVVCLVDAPSAEDDSIGTFLQRIGGVYADEFEHHMVLVISAREGAKLPAACIELPKPQFRITDLYEWVDEVTAGKEWSPDLSRSLKRLLLMAANKQKAPPPDLAYAALDDAIDLLRQNLTEAALRDRIQTIAASHEAHAPENTP